MSKPSTSAITFTSFLNAATVLSFSALLQACGGGGTATPASTAATVTGLSQDRLSYGRLSTFTATGTNLSTGVTFSATGCDGLAMVAGGSATQQVFTCTPNKALSVRVGATASGSEFYNATQAVPKPRVTLTTSMGVAVVELEPAVVATTVDNFLAYVKSGFYNGTIFHRVIKDFMNQGGGFTAVAGGTLTPQANVRAPIVLETNKGLNNVKYSIAMARTSASDSATAQFFVNAVNNSFLDYASAASPGYAVFGNIVSGQTVIDAMNAVATRTVGGFADVPATDIVLQKAEQTQ